MNKVELKGENLTIEDVINVAEKGYKVEYPRDIKKKISKFRKGLENYICEHPDKPVYGTTTGCGDLLGYGLKKSAWEKYCEVWKKYKSNPNNSERMEAFKKYIEALEDYQVRYIKAHNCGTGNPLPIEVVRAAMVIRLNSFAKGHSAVRLETCQLMIDMLNKGVTPWVLEEGSVGASGDLVPLAMIGAVLLGLPEAKAYYNGKLMSAPEALERAGLKPIKLGAKEAMALTNGSNFIAALAVFAIRDVELLLKNASIAAALSLEAIRGEITAFSENIANVRPHEGHKKVSQQIRNLLEGSQRITKESQKVPFPGQINKEQIEKIEAYKKKIKDQEIKGIIDNLLKGANIAGEKVQDRYSFRCVPQVHGAVYQALEELKRVVEIEINSATDNPLFFDDGSGKFHVESGGNFHGQPLAVAIDYLKIALTSLALISNKRTFSMLDKSQSYGLPQDLAFNPSEGDTGLMISQYAAAARAAESRVLSTPDSIMSISTAANQEDFVSMGMNGALHLHKIIYNTQIVVAIEILCALRGLQMTNHLLPNHLQRLGRGTGKIYAFLNNQLPPVKQDQYIRTDMEKVIKMVRTGELVRQVIEIL
jgi:histidine ammonia-lyase